MVADDLPIIADIHHIEGVQPVLIIDVHAVGAIFQDIDHTGRRILTCRNNRVQAEGRFIYVGVVLDIVKQVEPELV